MTILVYYIVYIGTTCYSITNITITQLIMEFVEDKTNKRNFTFVGLMTFDGMMTVCKT